MDQPLLLPGDRARRPVVGGGVLSLLFAVWLWTLVEATVLPALGIAELPLNPAVPAVMACALAGRTRDTWVLAIGLGLVMDSFAGASGGFGPLSLGLVAALTLPLSGRVVISGSLMPALGAGALVLGTGLLSDGAMRLLGHGVAAQRWLWVEALVTAAVTWPLWSVLQRAVSRSSHRRAATADWEMGF